MIAKRIEPRPGGKSNIARLARYVVNAQGGLDPRSWSRTADYILDSNAEANEKGEKVGGVRVTNCFTDDPADATQLIQATQARNTKSKKDKTYHLVFSFPPGEQPPLEVLNAIEDELCATIGYADHQRISAVHIDTDHLHVHVAINKVHPTGHQNIEPYYDKQRLMAACERLEVKYGLERTNHGLGEKEHERRHARSAGRSTGRIQLGPEQRPEQRDSRFRAYLRESYNLKIADQPEAKTLNGLRNLSGCNMARLTERSKVLLSGNARHSLEQHGEEPIDGLRRPRDGDRTDAGPASRVIGATVSTIEAQSGIETLASYVAQHVAPAMREAKDWQAVHDALAEHGLEVRPRGAGLVIGDGGLPLWVRASQCGRDLAMKAMTERLGPYEAPKGQQQGQSRRAGYSPKPVHQHPTTAQLFAQYQREKQNHIAARKIGMEQIKKENAAYLAELRHWSAQQRALLKIGGRGVTRRTMSVTIRNQTTAARNKHRAAIQQKREQLYKSTVMPSWADWLARQAEGGNPDALDVLRSRAEREEKMRGDLLTAQNADRAKAVLLKTLKPATRRDGTVSYRTADGGMVIDRKSHVQAQKATTGAALIALTLAAEKFDGQPLIVEGTDQFKQDVAQLAGLHRLKVVFADPAMEQARQQAEAERETAQTKAQEAGYSRLVEHGPAPYENNPRSRQSYFVTLENDKGEPRTIWGVDLERAITESRAELGDKIRLEHVTAEPVTLPNGETVQRNQWHVEKAPKAAEKGAATGAEPSKSVTDWIEKRNSSRDKISSLDYHRLWQQSDAGRATYQGRRKMEDGSEVLLLKRGDEMLVKPSGPRVVAKASKFKVGQPVVLDARGRFVDNSRVMER